MTFCDIWLVDERSSKIPSLTCPCMHKTVPQYLQELVSLYNPSGPLCFSAQCILSMFGFAENTNKKHSGAWSFLNAANWWTPTGTGHQTHSIMQRTLCPFGGNWTPICFQLCSHQPASSFPSPDLFSCVPFLAVSLLPVISPHPLLHRLLHRLLQEQQACGCLHGVKLCYASGHWQTDSETKTVPGALSNEESAKLVCDRNGLVANWRQYTY